MAPRQRSTGWPGRVAEGCLGPNRAERTRRTGVVAHTHDLPVLKGEHLRPAGTRAVRRTPGVDDGDSIAPFAHNVQVPVRSALPAVELDP